LGIVLKGRGFSRAEQVFLFLSSERASAREESAFQTFCGNLPGSNQAPARFGRNSFEVEIIESWNQNGIT